LKSPLRRAQLAARSAERRAFTEAARNGASAAATRLDGVLASAGAAPSTDDGKLSGAISCSDGTSAEDETTCLSGAGARGRSLRLGAAWPTKSGTPGAGGGANAAVRLADRGSNPVGAPVLASSASRPHLDKRLVRQRVDQA
jgi:hypothetical protein